MTKSRSAGEPAKTHSSDEQDEGLFADLPNNISRSQLKAGWKARELIWRLKAEGRNPYQISPNIHVPVRVVEFINSKSQPTVPPSSPPSSPSSEGGAQENAQSGSVEAQQAQGPAKGPVKDPVREETKDMRGFERKTPSTEEIDKAREVRHRIVDMQRGGMSFSQIGRVLKLPVKAIETAMQEDQDSAVPPTPPPSGGLWSPSWTVDPGPQIRPVEDSGWSWRPSPTGTDVLRALRDLGARGSLPEFCVRRWESGEMSAERLQTIVAESGAPREIATSISNYVRERNGQPLPSGAGTPTPLDPLAEAMRAHRQRLADELMEADAKAAIMRAQREAAGQWPQTASGDPEMREQVRKLEAELAQYRERDAVSRATQPLEERLRRLEHASDHKESPQIEAERMSNSRKNDAQSNAIQIVTERAQRAPTLLQLAQTERGRRTIAVLDKKLEKWAREEGVDLGGERLLDQGDEAMADALRRLEAGLGQSEPPAPPPEATEPVPPSTDASGRRIRIPTRDAEETSTPAIEISGGGSIQSR